MKLESIISTANSGRMIKHYIRSDLHISYSQFSKLKYCGSMNVNGEPVHANHILHEGDVVILDLPEMGAEKLVAPEDAPVSIIYEDDDIFIIDKPAPLACQSTPKQPYGTLENRVIYHYRHMDNFVFRPLNRLDKGTSGLMAAAKHAHAFQLLQRQLHTSSFVREYEAIVDGELSGEGAVELPIAKENAASVRRIIDCENGVYAKTYYQSLKTNRSRTLVRLRLGTGRTHQIRLHMASIGHPVTGDFLYGKEIADLPGRFALHSVHISLLHPLSGKRIVCDSALPDELKGLI